MSEHTRRVIELTKRAVRAEGGREIMVRHALMGALLDAAAATMMSETWAGGRELRVPSGWTPVLELARGAAEVVEKLPLGAGFREVFRKHYRVHGGMPPLLPLLGDLLLLPDPAVVELKAVNPGLQIAPKPAGPDPAPSRLGRLVDEVAALHNRLARKLVGQDEAIDRIEDAIFAARLYQREGEDAPLATLLFLGPTGVGKTYAARLIAEALHPSDPDAFLHLEMGAYADPNSARALVGFEPSFQGARPGALTGHVAAHPESLILVDEIEKAAPAVHHLFHQVLDRGRLEDKFSQRTVSFGQTVIVFTTNLGQDLGAGPRDFGASGPPVSRLAALEALRSASDPAGRPLLGPDFCSRLVKGQPILFRRLSPPDLERLARLALEDLDAEFQQRLGLRVPMPDRRMLSLLLLRLGPDLDARAVAAGAPLLVKDAFRDALTALRDQLASDPDLFERVRSLELRLPEGPDADYFRGLGEGWDRVLLITGRTASELKLNRLREFKWLLADDGRDAVDVLRRNAADFAVLDLDLYPQPPEAVLGDLRRLRATHPELPLLLYRDRPAIADPAADQKLVAASGARGLLRGPIARWPAGESCPLAPVREDVLRERFVAERLRRRTAVEFEWRSELKLEDKEAAIRLQPREIREAPAPAAKDRASPFIFAGVPAERFDQVAGAEEAKRRLREVIGWMRNPEAIRSLGIELPAGVLLEGPPGGGKTLLARALAGEAGLPFFAASGADFASKWVGESEKNVRALFERAAANAPSILFIDEIDAIGTRGVRDPSGVGDRVLTQLLVGMDGFARRERPIFFLAATNRADLLDPALKRPGRFDYMIAIGDLDVVARAELFRIKTRNAPLAPDVDLDALARAAWGLSGAELAQVTKEAAILAFREAAPGAGPGEIRLSNDHFREALTNVRYGLRTEGPRPAGEDLRLAAYHEAGHALIAELERPGGVAQATILPHGRALGFVETMPSETAGGYSAAELRSRVRIALAGRAAEILIFGKDRTTSGCAQDLAAATRIAALAVAQFGMSEKIGPISLTELGRLLPHADVERAREEIEAIVREQERAVETLLAKHKTELDYLARILIENETVDGERIAFVGKKIREQNGEK